MSGGEWPTSVDIVVTHRAADGWNQPAFTTPWRIKYDPDLPVRGQVNYGRYGDPRITLREWDERVLLHEVLHVLVGRLLPSDGNQHHDLVGLIEVGVLGAGFHYHPTDALREPTLCSQCGERMSAMVKVGTADGWCTECLDDAVETPLREQVARVEALRVGWRDEGVGLGASALLSDCADDLDAALQPTDGAT